MNNRKQLIIAVLLTTLVAGFGGALLMSLLQQKAISTQLPTAEVTATPTITATATPASTMIVTPTVASTFITHKLDYVNEKGLSIGTVTYKVPTSLKTVDSITHGIVENCSDTEEYPRCDYTNGSSEIHIGSATLRLSYSFGYSTLIDSIESTPGIQLTHTSGNKFYRFVDQDSEVDRYIYSIIHSSDRCEAQKGNVCAGTEFPYVQESTLWLEIPKNTSSTEKTSFLAVADEIAKTVVVIDK